MSLIMQTMESGDHIPAPKAPAEGNVPKVRVAMGAGEALENLDLVGLEANKQRVEKRGRKKGKRERRRKSSGWRAQLLSCFGCGAANQDKEELEKEQLMEEKQRLKRKAHEACLQKFRELAEDNQRHKESYERIQRCRRLVEANKAWSALPRKPKDAEKKVAFHEVHRCHIWHFEEEPVPTHMWLLWAKMQEELRQNEMERAAQLERAKEMALLTRREEGQRALLKQKAPAKHSDPYKAMVVLVVFFGYLLFLWLRSQMRGVFQKIRSLK